MVQYNIPAVAKAYNALKFASEALPSQYGTHRHGLSCIHIEEKGGFVYIVGTNSHILNIAKMKISECEIPISPNEHWNFEVKKLRKDFFLIESNTDYPDWKGVMPAEKEIDKKLERLEFYDYRDVECGCKTSNLSKSYFRLASSGACFAVDYLEILGLLNGNWLAEISTSRRCGIFKSEYSGIEYTSLIMGIHCDGAWVEDSKNKKEVA